MRRSPLSVTWDALVDLIYPPVCLVCRAPLERGALCSTCVGSFVPLHPPFCDRCGAPAASGGELCARCASGAVCAYEWSHALGAYTGSLRTAIHRLKYDGKANLAEPLGLLLAHSLDSGWRARSWSRSEAGALAFDRVVPVPLHAVRHRERGFNQAERIAWFLARERGWQLDTRHLRRRRRTRTQTTLDVAARALNVQGAFTVGGGLPYAGMSVLLIDDVLTTTATVNEAARAVREAGAVRVCVAALARD